MTENLSAGQVEYFISVATGMGIPAPEVPALWRQHMAWADANGLGTYGGRPWIKYCEAQVEFIKERKGLSDREAKAEAERALRRANERIAKDRADAEYAKTSISLSDYIGELRARPDFNEHRTELEAHIAGYRDPRPGEDAAAWLMAAVDGYRGTTPEAHVRRRKV